MRKLAKLFFILISINCYSQNDGTILIVPMKSNLIEFDNHVVRMLNYNRLNIDSLKKTVLNLSISQLKISFPGYTFINLQSDTSYAYLIDSLKVFCQWNSFQIKKILDSKGLEKIILSNDEDPKLKYYGHVIKERDLVAFRILIKKYNCKYILFINKFETWTNGNTNLSLHLEIYDQTMNKIYGSKNNWNTKISRTMYGNLFNYYLKSSIEEHYGRIKDFFKNP